MYMVSRVISKRSGRCWIKEMRCCRYWIKRSFADPMDSIRLIYVRSYFNKEMGYVLLAEKNITKQKNIFEAEQIASRSFNTAPSNKADLLIGLGECHYQMKQYEQTIRLTDSALALLSTTASAMFYKRIYEMRANSFDQLGKFNESLTAQRLFKAISDSINNNNQQGHCRDAHQI